MSQSAGSATSTIHFFLLNYMEDFNKTEVTEFIFLAFGNSSAHPILLFMILLFLYLFIVSGNMLMILVIRYDSRLHTPMYFFVFILSCSDICSLTVTIPQTLCNLLGSSSSILYNNCATQMFFFIVFGAVQLVIVSIMAYDRYVAIGNPLRYKIVMCWETCLKLLGLALIFGCALSFVVVYILFRLPFCRTPEIAHFYCDTGQIMLLTCHNWLAEITTFLLGIGVITIPILILITSYIYIIGAVLKIRTTKGKRKALSTCSSHITIVVVEYGCLGFMYFRPTEAYYLDKDKVFVMTFTFLAPILNPVVYTVRNKAVHDGLKRLISTRSFKVDVK
ncbi:hypothetical protein GDO81_007331 [Engystomops pustulosus]|uniref:G-protein coupled receptors family 1 profile domain-containing protein n=1 Tax=Engystomops pustulosus TaxID=76066 RepID=A0AAV7C6C3_ENGPU|nr:hypothetical protein GDO81_007331 [Engystomops pustulosus]